jgi:hypothetical protein
MRVALFAHARVHFECQPAEGKPFVLYDPIISCGDGIRRVVYLDSGRDLKHWDNLREGFVGLYGTDTFSVRVVCELSSLHSHRETPEEKHVVRSNWVRFTVVEAKGEELQAIHLIARHLPRRQDAETPVEKFTQEQKKERQAERNNRRDLWLYCSEALHDVLNETKSPRFRVAALLQGGWRFPGDLDDAESTRKAIADLTFVRSSHASSRFVKGLATLSLLRWRLFESSARAAKEANALARELTTDYADTALADEAIKVVEAHRKKLK